ncbi:hypothetical protein CRM22_003280 [Opisthorchis felineus]|uniref:Junctophilin n=1 Tax=Opisthorchis felineus TaxID=147828 RepID=A0A4V3SFY2_OPIFE|nr:hypothetical protein CRM22_003280 [Opisthorchis felineus]
MEAHFGRFDFDDGGTYIGQWLQGYAHGLGLAVGPNGVGEYSGEWESGFETCGVYIWPSGNRYTGTWSNGKRHGNGQQIRGKWVYQGQFTNGSCGPFGVKSATNCITSYEGSWNMNRFEGFGVETCSDGSVYAGEWNRGLRHGLGVRRTCANSTNKEKELSSDSKVMQTEEYQNETETDAKTCEAETKCTVELNQDRKPGSTLETFRVSKKAQLGRAIMKRLRKQHSAMELECSTDSSRFYALSKSVCDPDGSRLLRSPGASTIPEVAPISQSARPLSPMEQSPLTDVKLTSGGVKQPTGDDLQFVEVYSGQWFEDKRCGYGITERSNDYKYIGEWSKNQRHGFGVAYLPDGTKEEGEFQADQLIVRLNRKNKLQVLRQSKLKEYVENALIRAGEASKEARTKSAEQAETHAELARIASRKAEEIVFKARCLSQKARYLVREIQPAFKQPGLQWETKRCAGNPSTSRPLGTTSDATALPDLLSPDLEEQVPITPKTAITASTIRLGKLWRSKILRVVTNRLLPQDSQPISHASVKDADTFERFAKIGNPRLGLERPSQSQELTSWSLSPQKVTTSTNHLDKTESVRQAEAKHVSILVDKSRGPANQSARELRQNQSETKLLRQQRIKQAKPITSIVPLTENETSLIGDTSELVDILHSQLFVQAPEEKVDNLKEPQPGSLGPTPLAYSRAASVPRDRERRTLEWSTCRQKSLPNASTGQHNISTFGAKPLEAQSYSRTAQAETPQESELESEGLYDQGLVSSIMRPRHSPTSFGLENRVKKAIEHEVWAEQSAEPLHAPKLESRHTQDSGYLSMDPSDRSFSIRTLSHSFSHQMSVQADKGSSPRIEGVPVCRQGEFNKQLLPEKQSVAEVAPQSTLPMLAVSKSSAEPKLSPPDPKRARPGNGHAVYSEQRTSQLPHSKKRRTTSRSRSTMPRFRSPLSPTQTPSWFSKAFSTSTSRHICSHGLRSPVSHLERKESRGSHPAFQFWHANDATWDQNHHFHRNCYLDAESDSIHSISTAHSAPPCHTCGQVENDCEIWGMSSLPEDIRSPVSVPLGNRVKRCPVLPTKLADSMTYPHFANSPSSSNAHRVYCSKYHHHPPVFSQRSSLSVDNATRYSDQAIMTSKTSTHCSVFSCPIHTRMPVDSCGILSNDTHTLPGHYSDHLETPGTIYQEGSELRDLHNCRSCNHKFVCEKRVPSVRIGAQRSRFCCHEAAKNSLVHHNESGFQKAYDLDNESCPYALSGVSLVNAPMSTDPQTSSHALGDQGWNNGTPNCLDPKKHNEANFSYESEFRHDQGIRITPRRVSWPRQVYQQLNCFSKLVSRTNSERSNSSATLVGSNSSPITVVPSKPLFTKSESLHPNENGNEIRQEGSKNQTVNGQTSEDVFLMTQYRIPWYMSLKAWVLRHALNLIPLLLNTVMFLLYVLIPYWTRQNRRQEPQS